MKYMKRRGLKLFAVAALVPMISAGALTQQSKPAAATNVAAKAPDAVSQQLVERIHSFLANVPKNDPKVFEDFFADDVIYTRSAGVTVTKPDIIKNIDVRQSNDPEATFDGDDFTVHTYGDAAVVNFRLIMHNLVDGRKETIYFRNTGTFVKREGKWQAVAWQATRVPGVVQGPK
jgi:hypothetical protein